MTIPVTGITPIYGIEYLVQGEPARNTRAKLERNAKTVEAALARGGIAPPAAQDLAALAGRVTQLETSGVWTDLSRVAGSWAYAIPVTGTPTPVQYTSGEIPVPAGTQLELDFQVPQLILSANANVYVRMVIDNQVRRGAYFSTASIGSVAPFGLTDSINVLTAKNVSFLVQAWASSGSSSMAAVPASAAPMVLRARITAA